MFDNFSSQYKIDFEVLTPLKLDHENKLLLVDRGWIEKPKNNQLPVIVEVSEKQHLTGYIKTLNEYHFILGKNLLDAKVKPLVLQTYL